MATTTQQLVKNRLEKKMQRCGLVVADDRAFANTGYLRGYDPHSLDLGVEVYYDFQNRYFTLKGTVIAGNRETEFCLMYGNSSKLSMTDVFEKFEEHLYPLRPDLHGKEE